MLRSLIYLLFHVSETKIKGPPKPDPNELPSIPNVTAFDNNAFPHAVCGPGSAYGRGPFHKAVCEMDMAGIQIGLSSPYAPDSLKRRDELGFCPIHSACSLRMKNAQNSDMSVNIVRILLQAGADVSVADSEGNTPLHWAARSGDKGVTELLLGRSPQGKFSRGRVPRSSVLRPSKEKFALSQMQKTSTGRRLYIGP